jgi:hypothetical protein
MAMRPQPWFSYRVRMLIVQAEPRPITCARPAFAPLPSLGAGTRGHVGAHGCAPLTVAVMSSTTSRYRITILPSAHGRISQDSEGNITARRNTLLPNELSPGSDSKSTGPKSSAGKAIASRNAIVHAIRSDRPVLHGMERESDWRTHRKGVIASLAPEGVLENALADRVALLLWRLHRVYRYEIAVTDRHVAAAREDLAIADAYAQGRLTGEGVLPEPDPARVALAKLSRILPDSASLDKIMRYESHLHRQCIQTLHELEALQARRSGGQSRLVRLDINSLPSRLGGLSAARGQPN